MTSSLTIEPPETYERYQEFLPSFSQFVEAVTTKLAPACEYDTLRDIIDSEFSSTGVNYENEEFLAKVQDECDDYGYEDFEDLSTVFVEMTYAVRSLLIDEIQEYIEFLDICKLSEKAV